MLSRPLALLVLAAIPPLTAADTGLLGWLPQKTNFVIGIKVRNIADSQLGRSLAAEATAANPQWNLVFAAMGFDPTKDIDEVVIAVAGTGNNPPALIAASGRFAALRAGIAGKRESVQKLTFVDDNTVLAGDPALMKAALRRRPDLPAPMAARASGIASRYDIYAIGIPSLPEGAMPTLLNQVGRFQFGMAVSDGLDMALELDAPTAQKALEMEALLTQAMKSQKGAEDVLRYLKLEVEGVTLRASLTVPGDVMQKAVREGIAAAKSSPSPLAAALPSLGGRTTPAKPEEPSRVPAGAALLITGSESDGGTIVVTKP